MDRLNRLIAILVTLQSKKYVTAEFIAYKYNISARTVYRDLKALGEIGIPITHESNKGYYIIQSFFLPPVALTNEEANAIILISSLAERFTDDLTRDHVENAMNKIKAVLRTTDKDKADFLQSQIKVHHSSEESERSGFLNEIQDSILKKQILKIEYMNNKSEKSQREIEPIGLTFYSNQWHLIAWCWKRADYRDFKVNKISQLRNKCETFKKSAHYNINEYIKSLS